MGNEHEKRKAGPDPQQRRKVLLNLAATANVLAGRFGDVSESLKIAAQKDAVDLLPDLTEAARVVALFGAAQNLLISRLLDLRYATELSLAADLLAGRLPGLEVDPKTILDEMKRRNQAAAGTSENQEDADDG